MKILVIISMMLFLAACSTTMSDKQVEAMNTPTLTLSCTSGCTASYTDPRDRPPMPTNGYDVLNTAINATSGIITSTAPWAAIGITAAEGIKSAVGNSDNSVRNSDSSTRDVTNNNDDYSNRDNSVRNNDDNRIDNSSRDNRTFDSTHEPTVVTQPSPIVVHPEVVQQPAAPVE